MKKFLVILMVVAMASFLFVGCMPGVTPPVDDEDEDEDVGVATSDPPVLTAVEDSAGAIIFLATATGTLYMNTAEAGSSIMVTGTNAPSGSSVQIYLDDVAIAGAVGETAVTGLWAVAVAKSSLGADGVGKVLHATVTEVGLAESAASNSVTFTLDTDNPGFSIAVTATGNSAVVPATFVSGSVTIPNPITALTVAGTTGTIVSGAWTIEVLGDSTMASNVTITSSLWTPNTKTYNIDGGETFTDVIPGVAFTFNAPAPGSSCIVTTTALVPAVAGVPARATITFDEDVSNAVMAAGTYNILGDPTTYYPTIRTGYWNTGTTAALVPGAAGTVYTITAYGITDLAGNPGGTLASPLSASCTVGAASLTLLAP